jgi:hypothetical protein
MTYLIKIHKTLGPYTEGMVLAFDPNRMKIDPQTGRLTILDGDAGFDFDPTSFYFFATTESVKPMAPLMQYVEILKTCSVIPAGTVFPREAPEISISPKDGLLTIRAPGHQYGISCNWTESEYRFVDVSVTTELTGDTPGCVAQAMEWLKSQIRNQPVFTSPDTVKDFLRLLMQSRYPDKEAFGALWVDSQHKMIAEEILFEGTLSSTSIFPREVIKRALHHNAAAVMLFHNHPSGNPKPSRADEHMTSTLKKTLAMIDVRVLDHLVIGNPEVTSFAEMGLL